MPEIMQRRATKLIPDLDILAMKKLKRNVD